MSHSGDDDSEMFRRTQQLDDQTIERLLSGDADVAGQETLVSFVEDAQFAAAAPGPRPSPMLASLFAEGLSTEKGELPATAASNVTGPAPQAAGLPKWSRDNMIDLTRTKLAKIGLAAKVGIAVSVLGLSGTAAAATGSLPDAAQTRIADVVERAGINIPGATSDEHRQDAENRQDDAEVGEVSETPESAEFGDSVSDRATDGEAQEDGREFGEDVSSDARETHQPEETPTAEDNPGTEVREGAPAGQPEETPTAEDNPGTEVREQAPADQPEETPTAEDNPGTSQRP